MRHTIRVRVRYPAVDGRIVLRGAPDWQREYRPVAVAPDRTTHEFEIEIDGAFWWFKPVLIRRDAASWAQGHDFLATAAGGPREIFPYFSPDERCAECELVELSDPGGRTHALRVFYPPGYWENTLARYPTLYMQDGQNLFFPGEAFGGQHWRVAETLRLLDRMNALTQLIAVGVYPGERERDYTAPGYVDYARFLAAVVKPWIDRTYRTLPAARHTAIAGSSLGGVAALHVAWSHPGAFGQAACLSSTFGWRDDLRARISRETRPAVRLYLDSGWPNDNYEATRDLRALLVTRGFVEGHDLHYFAFPGATHDERAWATRLHLPVQLFFGSRPHDALPSAARAARTAHELAGA